MTKKKPLKTYVYLFLINGLTLCIGFIFFIIITINTMENTALVQSKRNLRTFALVIERLIKSMPEIEIIPSSNQDDTIKFLDILLKELAADDSFFRITVIDSDGVVLGDSDYPLDKLVNHRSQQEVVEALSGKESCIIRKNILTNEKTIYYAYSFNYKNRELILRLSMPTAANVFFSSNIQIDNIVIAMVVLIVVLGISFFVLSKVIRPLTELKRAASHYQKGDFDFIPKVSGLYEFKELSNVFYDMSKTIQGNILDISRQRDEFLAVFSTITEGLLVFNQDFQILRMNAAAKKILNFTDAKTPNPTVLDLLPSKKIARFLNKVLESNNDIPLEIETEIPILDVLSQKQISKRSILMHSVIYSNNPEPRYLLVIADITKLKKLEHMRKDFVASVSHELKTPITAIKGFIETLQDGALEEPETAKFFLSIMEQQSSRLSSIIEDLLMLSRVEHEEVMGNLETVPVFLKTLVTDVIYTYSFAAEKKGITFEQNFFPEGKPIEIVVNTGLFLQVLYNIIDNAIKYCPEGSKIIISAFLENNPVPKKEKEKLVRIHIEDTGYGVPEDIADRLFEKFYRIENDRNREKGGTGLGLAIAHDIITLHEGTIRLIPRPNKEPGCCFEIILPVKDNSILQR